MNVNKVDEFDFAPSILGVQQKPPSPLPRIVLRGILCLLALLILWACIGRLDVVAVAEGKLVPSSYLKIVQPSDAGIVKEIMIEEGQLVKKDQVLVRMDAHLAKADSESIQQALQHKTIELRRIESELSGTAFKRENGDDSTMFQKVNAAYLANVRALQDDIASELAAQQKAQSDLAATIEVQHKLEQTLPSYQTQEASYEELGKKGFAGRVMVDEKKRQRIEAEQDLHAQKYTAQSLRATINQSTKRIAQIRSDYRKQLEADRVIVYSDLQKLKQEWAKQSHKNSLLELRAPQAGIIKDLATHTPGTVVSPGTVLMTLVPKHETLNAEVWLKNEDAGFVSTGQTVKVKLMAYPFQKYGMVDGKVVQVSADATDRPQANSPQQEDTPQNQPSSSYKTLVKLKQQYLELDGNKLMLNPGMQVAAEIKLADQTVMEYLLSPVRKAFHEAARER